MVERVTFCEGHNLYCHIGGRKYGDICAQGYAFPAEVSEQMTVRVEQDELLKPETEIPDVSCRGSFFVQQIRKKKKICAYYVL